MKSFTYRRRHLIRGNQVFYLIILVLLAVAYWSGYRLGLAVERERQNIPRLSKNTMDIVSEQKWM